MTDFNTGLRRHLRMRNKIKATVTTAALVLMVMSWPTATAQESTTTPEPIAMREPPPPTIVYIIIITVDKPTPSPVAQPEPEPILESLGTFKLYAYCPCAKCCRKSDGITKTGTTATQGRTIAVDPDIIPFGTRVVIDGLGEFIAEDTGTGVDGLTIDVYMDDHEAALEFGVQYAEVWIVR